MFNKMSKDKKFTKNISDSSSASSFLETSSTSSTPTISKENDMDKLDFSETKNTIIQRIEYNECSIKSVFNYKDFKLVK